MTALRRISTTKLYRSDERKDTDLNGARIFLYVLPTPCPIYANKVPTHTMDSRKLQKSKFFCEYDLYKHDFSQVMIQIKCY